LLFRSENNILAGTDCTQGPRRHHDFLDDLESFLWVYVWFTMAQDGPGEEALLSKPCRFITELLQSEYLPHLRRVKHFYMRDLTDLGEVVLTPYFSQPPYLELSDNLRKLLEGYRHPKQRGEDLFPQMDGIYREYLACFDSAIEQLGGTTDPMDPPSHLDVDIPPAQQEHKLTVPTSRRIQPDRRAKRAREDDIVASRETKKARVVRPPAARSVKRIRDDDPVMTREPKKRKVARLPTNPRARKEDVKPPTGKAARGLQDGTRRSERTLKKGKARNSLTSANSAKRAGSKRA